MGSSADEAILTLFSNVGVLNSTQMERGQLRKQFQQSVYMIDFLVIDVEIAFAVNHFGV